MQGSALERRMCHWILSTAGTFKFFLRHASAGPLTLKIAYTGILTTSSARFLSIQGGGTPPMRAPLEPTVRGRAFPSFDEPSLKANFQ